MCVAVLTVMWCRCGGSECEWSDGHKSVSNTQPTCQHWHLASVTTCHICQWHRTCSSSFYKCRFCFIVLIEVRKVILVVTFLIVLIVTFLFWSLCFAAFHNQASELFFFFVFLTVNFLGFVFILWQAEPMQLCLQELHISSKYPMWSFGLDRQLPKVGWCSLWFSHGLCIKPEEDCWKVYCSL